MMNRSLVWSLLFSLSTLSAHNVCQKIVLVGGTIPSALEKSFVGQPIDSQFIMDLRHTIANHYKDQSHPFVEVVVSPGEISDGVIHVEVRESQIGNVSIQGARYTSDCLLLNEFNVRSGDPIDTSQVIRNLNFMNHNPFRRVNVIYSPGENPGTTDVELAVEDRFPVRVYAGTDDTGIPTTERGRFFTGINIAQLGCWDQFFTYQYTSSYNFHDLQAHTGQYIAYLPWKHKFNAYGGYSSVYANLPFPGAANHGQSYQASGRYTIPMFVRTQFSDACTFGFDFKRTNNTIAFSELFPVVGSNVNLSQFMVSYSGNFEKWDARMEYEGEIFFSPGAIMGDQSNADYQTLRPAAQNHWVYGRVGLSYLQKLPASFLLSLKGRGQLSSQNLLPSEQVGLGGYSSVRGYDERQLNYDSGLILNGEFLLPAFSVLDFFRKKRQGKDFMQFLAFADYGYGSNHNTIAGERKDDYLLGAGPGVRYTIDPWLTTRLDVGFKLHQEERFTGGWAMWHFGFVLSL